MGRRKILLIALVALGLLAVVVAIASSGSRMATYEGKTLETWLQDCSASTKPIRSESSPTKAVMRIGTNGIPVMLNWVLYERPAWKATALGWLNKLSPASAGKFNKLREWLLDLKASQRAEYAKFGFSILGPKAISAVPALQEELAKGRSATVQDNIRFCLVAIQLPVETLASRVDYHNADIAEAAAEALGWCDPKDRRKAARALAWALQDSNHPPVRRAAAIALRNFPDPDQLTLDALRSASTNPHEEVRLAARETLDLLTRGAPAQTNNAASGAK